MPHATVPYGDPARTGRCHGPGVAAEPKLVRRYPTGAPPSLPTVTGEALYAGDAEGVLHAFDIATGARLWRHERPHDRYGNGIERPPAVTPDMVIAGADEQVLACSRADGRERWQVEGLCPTVVDDLLLVLDDTHGLRAFDAATGHPRWSTGGRRFDGLAYGLLQSAPTIARDAVLVAEGYEGHHTHGGLHAFDRHTGTPRWGMGESHDACTRTSPCAAADKLENAPFHPVWAHDLVWTVRTRLHDDATVEELAGLDLATGTPRWVLSEDEWLDTGAGEHIHGAPVLGPALAYCHTEDRVDALDIATKTVRWTRRLDTPIAGTPLLAGDVLHLAAEGGVLQGLDAATGEPLWKLTLDEDTAWSADFPGEYDEPETVCVLDGGTLFARTENAVLAFR